ncbi:phasin family protein [bacterium]|nr:phasin family protein [bacterium]
MLDLLKKTALVGLGALVMTEEKIEEIVKDLVKKGEVSQGEGKTLVSELMQKAEAGKKEIEEKIEAIVKKTLRKLDIPSRSELKEIKAKLDKLEK